MSDTIDVQYRGFHKGTTFKGRVLKRGAIYPLPLEWKKEVEAHPHLVIKSKTNANVKSPYQPRPAPPKIDVKTDKKDDKGK